METVSVKVVASGTLLILSVVTGFILSHSSRPLGVGPTTIHKLIAVGSIVLMALAFRQIVRVEGIAIHTAVTAIVTAVLFLSLVATGALLTREEMALPRIVIGLHRVAPFAVFVTSGATFLLMIGRS